MFEKLRADFAFLDKKDFTLQSIVYVDNAATTQKPHTVINAIANFYRYSNANVYRGIHSLAEHATQQYEDARKAVANYINADTSEIVFTSGATAGLNFIAHTWALEHLKVGDTIVLTYLEHHANIVPWQYVAQKTGAQLRYIPVLYDGTLDKETFDTYFDDSVKLLTMAHVSNTIGIALPIAELIACARRYNALVMIDACQSAPHMLVNITQLQPDFLVFSGHKMLGPTGIGVLYINKKLHTLLEPYQRGGGMVFNVQENSATWLSAPHKFEAGTPPIAQAVGLHAALDYLTKNVEPQQLKKHYAQLCTRFIEGLEALEKIQIIGPKQEIKKSGHIVSFIIQGFHSHDVAAYLSAHNIFVRAGNHCAQPLSYCLNYDSCVRVSFYFYNTLQEVEYILNALQKLIQ